MNLRGFFFLFDWDADAEREAQLFRSGGCIAHGPQANVDEGNRFYL